MSYIYQRKCHSHLHKIKRLNHDVNRHGEKKIITNLPLSIIDITSQYVKYFDYPLADLLADHSTDPLQNTARQYVDRSTDSSNEGRFQNHEMIIRRNGETTILKPKQDVVLANGFTPVIRPSSILPSYQSIVCHTQPASSFSIMNKMSTKKPEQTSVIKTKRRNRYRHMHYNETYFEKNRFHNHELSSAFHQNDPFPSEFIHVVQQTLYDMAQQNNAFVSKPVPLMSIQPQFHPESSTNYPNQSTLPRLDYPNFNPFLDRSSTVNHYNFTQPLNFTPTDLYRETSFDLSAEQNYLFDYTFQRQETTCSFSTMNHRRNHSQMSDCFFH